MPCPRAPKAWLPPTDRPARILLVRLSALGDVIHALPVLAGLRRELPDARIDWAVEDRAVDLLRARPEIERVVVFPRRELRALERRPLQLLRRALAFRQELRAVPYDVALDLQGNLKSGVVTRLSRARVRFGGDRRVVREANHLFTNRRALPPPDARHRVERNLALLSALLGREVTWIDPGLATTHDASARAEAALRAAHLPARGFVLLHPGTSRFGAFKRWPPERFGDLARALLAEGHDVAVSAPGGEVGLARSVVHAAGNGLSLVETNSLAVLGEVIRRARVVVAADTGPLHLAALAGTPLLGLFGPKDPAVYGPFGRRSDGTIGLLDVVARQDVACRPCTLRTCEAPICMTGIEPDVVLDAVREISR